MVGSSTIRCDVPWTYSWAQPRAVPTKSVAALDTGPGRGSAEWERKNWSSIVSSSKPAAEGISRTLTPSSTKKLTSRGTSCIP